MGCEPLVVAFRQRVEQMILMRAGGGGSDPARPVPQRRGRHFPDAELRPVGCHYGSLDQRSPELCRTAQRHAGKVRLVAPAETKDRSHVCAFVHTTHESLEKNHPTHPSFAMTSTAQTTSSLLASGLLPLPWWGNVVVALVLTHIPSSPSRSTYIEARPIAASTSIRRLATSSASGCGLQRAW